MNRLLIIFQLNQTTGYVYRDASGRCRQDDMNVKISGYDTWSAGVKSITSFQARS